MDCSPNSVVWEGNFQVILPLGSGYLKSFEWDAIEVIDAWTKELDDSGVEERCFGFGCWQYTA